MNIYVYSDESGVLDKKNNDVFVFSGLIILSSEEKEFWSRKYSAAENVLRNSRKIGKKFELKATNITNKEKGKLFRSLNNCYKFSAIVNQEHVLDSIFENKKSKQRYLDYVYKIAVKRAFEKLKIDKVINPEEVERLYFYVDEHTTATNGCYELKESLEQEFRFGTFNYNYSCYFPPIFPKLKSVELEYCNSKSKLLVRASDIVANKVFYLARNKEQEKLMNIKKMNITYFP